MNVQSKIHQSEQGWLYGGAREAVAPGASRWRTWSATWDEQNAVEVGAAWLEYGEGVS